MPEGSFLSFDASHQYLADSLPSSCHERPARWQRAVAVSRDSNEAHGGRLENAALRQGELPPQTFDACDAAFVLDCLPKLLVDDSHLGSGRRFAIPYSRESEEIARKLRAARMEDEGSAHAEDSTEKAGFEDDIVSRRRLTGSRRG